MKTLQSRPLAWLSLIVIALLTQQSAHAATLIWTNTAGGLWSNATNWSPNTVPGAADTAIVTNSGTYVVTNNATVNLTALTLGDTNATGTPTIYSSSAFTVTNTTVASNGVIALIAGTLTTAGPATIVGTVNQAAGTWQLNTAATINNYNLTNGELRGANCVITNLTWLGGSLNSDALGNVTTVISNLTISGATAKQLSYYVAPGRTLNNNGTATWTGAGITGQGGATINNGGTMTLNGDFGFAWGGSGAGPVLNNTGTLTKASGSGAFTLTQIYFNNFVTCNISSGSFAMNSCVVTNQGIYLSPSGYFDLNSGTTALLGGVLSCSSGDHFRFLGATTTLTTPNITTPSLLLSSGILNQNTNVVVDTMNQANGTWQLNVPVALNNYNLTNGELRGANITITNLNWVGGSFNSDALGNVTTIPAGGTLTISGATGKGLSYYVTPGRTLNNNGTATWTGAGITGQGGATINNAGTMTLNGDFSYAWGGAGAAPVFNNTGTLTKASGSGAFTLSSIIVNNNNTMNIASGSLTFSSSQFHNYGNVSITAGTIAYNSASGTNYGTLSLNAGSFADFNSGSTYTLGGILSSPNADSIRFLGATVNLNTTNLTTPSVFLNTGILNQNTNVVVNTLNQANGTWQLNVPIVINNYNLTNGELRGANCVITNLNWAGGSLNSDALGNVTTIPIGGTLTISGATAKGLSYYVTPGRTLNNNGTATWTGAGITGQGGATINNGGTMTLNGDFTFAWGGSGNAPVLNNTGTLTKSSGSGAFTMSSIYFNNYVTANINSGSFALNSCAGTNLGGLYLASSAFLDFNSGTSYELGGFVSCSTGDHIRVLGATVNLNTTNVTTPSLFLNTGTLNQNADVVVNTLNQAAGTWRLNLPAAINNYNLTNGEVRGANVIITNFTWAGGSLNGENASSNTCTIPSGGTLTIVGPTAKSIGDYSSSSNGRRLINNGTGTWSGAGLTGYWMPEIINNNLFSITSDLTYAWGGNGSGPWLINNGTLNLTSGTDFALSSINFTNNGTFNITGGSLTMGGGSGGSVCCNNGALNLDATSFLYANVGTCTLNGSLSAPTANSFQFNGMTTYINTTNISTPALLETSGTVYQNTNVIVPTYNIAAGTLYPAVPSLAFNTVNLTNAELRGANVTITNFNWLGGSLNGDNAASNTVTIPVGGVFNISGATAKSIGDYSSSDNARRMINNGTINWSGAGITGYYKPQLINNSLLNITSDLGYFYGGAGSGPWLINNGTANLWNGTDLTLSTINFTNSGTFSMTNGSLTMGGGSGGTLCFNSGALNLDAGSFLYANVGSLYLNGSVSSSAGNHVQFNGMTTYINTPNISTPALLETSGTVFQNTNVVVPTYNIAAGTLYPTVPSLAFNTVNLTNSELRGANVVITNFNWLGGSLNGDNAASNTVTIPAGGVFNISGPTAKSIGDYSSANNARRMINNGTINWSGAGITGYYAPQLINNGQLNITSDLGYFYGGAGNGPWLINNGTASLWNGTDLTLSTVNFTNSGTFNLTNGSLTMNGGSGGTTCLNSGALNLDATSFLYANAGTFSLNGSLSAPTANSIQFNGMTTYINTTNITTPALLETAGTVFQNVNVVVPAYNIAAGTLNPTIPLAFNTLNLTNAELRGPNVIVTNFNWFGGSLNSENANSNTVTIPVGGTLNIAGANAKALSDYSSTSGRRIINNGAGTWGGTVGISGYYGARLENNGTLNLTNDVALVWGGLGSGPVFFNTGSFTKSAGTGVAAFTTTTITNSGTMSVSNGGFTVGAQFIQTAGSAKLGTNFTASSNVRIEAGTFDARGNIVGTFYNNGSSSPGSGPGLITGNTLTNSPLGIIRFEIGGTNPGTNFDQFRLTGPAIIDGTADLSLANGFVPVPGNTFTSIVCSARSGTFTNLTFSGGYVFTALYTPTTVVFRAENALPTASLVVAPTQLVCQPFVVTANAFDVGGVVTNTAIILDGSTIASAPGNTTSTTIEIDFPGIKAFIAQAIDDQGGVSYATQNVAMVTLPLHTLSMGPIPTNDSFKFCMLGQVNSNYTVVSATNITIHPTNWVPVGSMEYTNGIFRYTVSGMLTNSPFRYYRAKQQ